MSWTNATFDYQNKVIEALKFLAEEAYDAESGGDPVLANAYLAAADELMLWLNVDRQNDPFALWLEKNKEELLIHAGKAVSIHIDRGVVATGTAESFWDGSFRKEVLSAFKDDPKIYITVVPLKDGEVAEATEQQEEQ
jgi:hypothetical protein